MYHNWKGKYSPLKNPSHSHLFSLFMPGLFWGGEGE